MADVFVPAASFYSFFAFSHLIENLPVLEAHGVHVEYGHARVRSVQEAVQEADGQCLLPGSILFSWVPSTTQPVRFSREHLELCVRQCPQRTATDTPSLTGNQPPWKLPARGTYLNVHETARAKVHFHRPKICLPEDLMAVGMTILVRALFLTLLLLLLGYTLLLFSSSHINKR